MKNSNTIDSRCFTDTAELCRVLDWLKEISSEMDNINEHLDSMIADCVRYEQCIACV